MTDQTFFTRPSSNSLKAFSVERHPPAIDRQVEQLADGRRSRSSAGRDAGCSTTRKSMWKRRSQDRAEIALQHAAVAGQPDALAVVARVLMDDFAEIVQSCRFRQSM